MRGRHFLTMDCVIYSQWVNGFHSYEVTKMARKKFASLRRRKRPKLFNRKRSTDATNSLQAKKVKNSPQLGQVSRLGRESCVESATSSEPSSKQGGLSTVTTASTKKLSLKKPVLDYKGVTVSTDHTESSSSLETDSSNNDTTATEETDSDVDENVSEIACEGYRIVDLPSLSIAIGKAAMCSKCKTGNLSLHDASHARHGLASHLQVCCAKCDAKHVIPYPKNTMAVKEKEINQRSVLASRLIGRGRGAMRKFFYIMNMPGYISSRTYEKYSRRLCSAAEEEAQSSMKTAAEEVVRLHKEDPSLSSPTIDGIVDTTVTCDGTWHKRGFSSLHGVVIVMSLTTGQVLDYTALSKTCMECKTWNKRAGTPEYAAWKLDHNCLVNFEGSSSAMECQGTLTMWRRSEELHSLRYTQVIADGDSKSFSLLTESNPYSVPIAKLECVGHVQKRLGTGLRKLKKEKKLGGRGRLTDNLIDAMQTYYGKAIRNNKGNIKGMQDATWAILYHHSSTSPKTCHKFCPSGPTSWCKYKRGDTTYVPKSTLPMDVVNAIKPLFTRLTDKKLLEKCLQGYTQNQNEALNKEIWSLCPKTVHVGARTIRTAVALAVVICNNGWTGIERIAQRLNLPTARWLRKLAISLDSERVKGAQYRALPKTKQSRKIARRQRKKRNEVIKTAEGETYLPGGF